MSALTHVEHNVEVKGKKIKIIGVTHGGLETPLAPASKRAVAKIVGKHPRSALYAESTNTNFLPESLVPRAKPLEHMSSAKRELLSTIFKVTAVQENRQAHSGTAKRGLVHSGALGARWRQDFIHGATKMDPAVAESWFGGTKIPRTALAFLISGRSLQMAEKLLRAPEKEIIAVVGAVHAPLVKKFLENEKLRKRYKALWQRDRIARTLWNRR